MSIINSVLYQDLTQTDYSAMAGPDWPSYDQFLMHTNVPDFVYKEIDQMLDNSPFDNSAFCVLPFYGMEYPAKTPCCLLPKNHNINDIRKKMLAGTRPADCKKCWNLEDNGCKSDRLIKNETLDFYFNKNLKALFDDCVAGTNHVAHYKIDTSTVCNSTCITCSSTSSSAWAQLERKNKKTPKKTWSLTTTDVENFVDYKTAKYLGFRGGEPFLSDTNFFILEELIKHGNTDCGINFVTNGSSKMTNYQKKILSKFSNVNLCFSIDGVGPVFEYLRYPLKWNDLEQNIKYCRENNIMISASYTVSNLNVFYHNQTVDWFDQNNIPYLVNPVYNPTYFRPSALPSIVKDTILQTSEINFLLTTHTNSDDVDYISFRSKIAEQNAWKKIKMKDYIPEFAELIQFDDPVD